jgi:creatinine amidohydrolase
MIHYRSVQAELLRPKEIREALARKSVVYMPLGATEFHQEHLPIGLDGLNAHGITCEAALKHGGIVLPPLFIGTGGGHKQYPWTIMMDSDFEIRALIEKSLLRLNDFGVRVAVLFTGHFAPEQLEMIDSIASDWSSNALNMTVLALAINMPLDGAPQPDHAGLFETTVLSHFQLDTIDLSQLPTIEEVPSVDPDDDPYGLHRHDPEHVLWGVFGPDPRNYDPTAAGELVAKITDSINLSVTNALA